MRSSLPCFLTFCRSGIPTSCYIFEMLMFLITCILWISLVPSPTPSFPSNEANSGSLSDELTTPVSPGLVAYINSTKHDDGFLQKYYYMSVQLVLQQVAEYTQECTTVLGDKMSAYYYGKKHYAKSYY